MSSILLAPYVDSVPDKCGGKPCVAGTRIRVFDIFVWHELHGLSADEICVDFPHLTLSQVYGALSYFYDHREEILTLQKADDEFADAMEAKQKKERLNAALLAS